MGGLADIAADLGAFLQEAAPERPQKAPQREITSEEAMSLAGGVLDYVFAKAEPGDSSRVIGEAMVVGALAAGHDFGVHDASLAVAAVERLEQMAAAARSALTEATGPSVADAKVLEAVQRLVGERAKHVSAKMVAKESGRKLKPTIMALNRLQASGYLDYNLKAGYSTYEKQAR